MVEYTLDQIKAICDAAQLPLGVPFIDGRLEEYREKYNGSYPYYAAFRDLTQALRPGVVLEIGAWQGTSAAAFAAGCPEALVMTIDHHSDPGDDVNQARMIEACDHYENLIYIQACSSEKVHALKPGTKFALPFVQGLLGERKIDILFIDGWHHAEMAQADFDTYIPYLAPGGLVICDDIYGGNTATLFGMREFWDGLPGEKYLSTNLHGCYPIGFVRMP